MRLCLTCHKVSPQGSAFCGYCARSFGGRLCQNRHRNTPSARCCTTCGSPTLTEYARSLRLGWIPSSLSGLCALGAWKWLVAHPILFLSVIWNGATWLLAVLLNTSPCMVGTALRAIICLLIGCWLAGHALTLLPGGIFTSAGRMLRAVPVWMVRQVLRVSGTLLRHAVRQVRLGFWPVAKKTGSPSGKSASIGPDG